MSNQTQIFTCTHMVIYTLNLALLWIFFKFKEIISICSDGYVIESESIIQICVYVCMWVIYISPYYINICNYYLLIKINFKSKNWKTVLLRRSCFPLVLTLDMHRGPWHIHRGGILRALVLYSETSKIRLLFPSIRGPSVAIQGEISRGKCSWRGCSVVLSQPKQGFFCTRQHGENQPHLFLRTRRKGVREKFISLHRSDLPGWKEEAREMLLSIWTPGLQILFLPRTPEAENGGKRFTKSCAPSNPSCEVASVWLRLCSPSPEEAWHSKCS